MKGLLEVKEFDCITCNDDYKTEYPYLPKNVFHELELFIHSFAGDDELSDALDFFSIGYRRNIGETISVKNYVGLIQMQNGYQVQILPKILLEEDDAHNKKTKSVFMSMLRSMKDFPCKVFNDANLKMDMMNLYEIFINMYLQGVEKIVKEGLKSTYLTHEESLKYYKGKLVVNEQLKNNIAHKEKFYVSYDEYNVNRAENKLIKATLLKLQTISDSFVNQRAIRQLLSYFERVVASINYEKDFSEVAIDRNTIDYEPLMRWSKVFLFNKSFTSFSGSTSARALLFPMEKVFESYVAQELRKVVIPKGWKLSTQDRRYHLFDDPSKFTLIPDIVLTRDDGSVIVLDTKWKSLIDDPSKNYGISQPDMYQMYVYGKKYKTSEIWLLYPVNEQMRDHEPISFKSEDNINVYLYFVDVANIKECLQNLSFKIENTVIN